MKATGHNTASNSSPANRLISPYRERPLQASLRLLCDQNRFMVLVIHRRFGKTVFAINRLIQEILKCPYEAPRGHYFAPTFKQAKNIAWDYLLRFTSWIPGTVQNRTELSVSFPLGQKIMLFGADNPDAFRGAYSDYSVIDEVAMMPPRIWGEIVRPALADREGKALFIGTPAGHNQFFKLYEKAGTLDGWGRALLRHGDTGVIADHEIKALRAEMEPEEFEQEFECSFTAAIRGAYYGKVLAEAERAGRVCSVPYDDSLPVTTAWDLGMADATAIWFLQATRGGEIRAIDYEEYHGAGLPEIVRALRQKPYQYGKHIAPHDIRVRELGTGTSRYEVAAGLGIRFDVARNLPLMDGIDATRTLLKRCWFDREKAGDGFNHLQQYRTEENQRTGVFSLRPLHDHTSHAADALRMYAVESRGNSGNWGSAIQYDLVDNPGRRHA